MGYGNRTQGSTGVHDRLWARALLLADENRCWGIVACDLRCLNAESVREARVAIQRRLGLSASDLFICTTHTHSGPHDRDPENWDQPLAERLADAVQEAYAALQPARLGSGYGLLYGSSVNRRWLDRPIDPSVAVVRVEAEDGHLLGLVTSFGCHPVVLGYDNYQISADWPGYAAAHIEQRLGSGVTCLFLQGGGGNVNPLVTGVRHALQSGRQVTSIGNISTYYGQPLSAELNDIEPYNIGDRKGGTFAEVAELGTAFAGEVLKVYNTIVTSGLIVPIWSEQLNLDAAAAPDYATDTQNSAQVPAEIMLLAVNGILFFGQPGEVFSETSVWWRSHLRSMGYRTPMIIGHANGWLSYLPEPADFLEGGYEIQRAQGEGTHSQFQQIVRREVRSVLRRHADRADFE